MERLGLGPEVCLARNPALIYGRMTGWGQTGPEAHTAGHDIDYIALAGALASLGCDGEPPQAPLNLLGDFGGGGLLLAFGVAAALVEVGRSGRGQVVDAAMVDGAALLMTMMYELLGHGVWEERRSANMIDGDAPFYGTYATSDGEYMAVGALEPPFYAALLKGLDLTDADAADQWDRAAWPAQRDRFTAVFAGAPGKSGPGSSPVRTPVARRCCA